MLIIKTWLCYDYLSEKNKEDIKDKFNIFFKNNKIDDISMNIEKDNLSKNSIINSRNKKIKKIINLIFWIIQGSILLTY